MRTRALWCFFGTTYRYSCCLTAGQVLSELGTLRAFCDREDSSPKYLVLPKHLGVAWAENFHNIHLVEVSPAGRLFSQSGDLPAKQLFEVYVVERRPSPGVLGTAELPDAIWSLPRDSLTPQHTVVFDARIAGINTSVLFDGGSTTSFVDSGLVQRYGLSIRADPQEVRMANGSTITSPGTVRVHLTI
jgi:hypothetical protein